MGKSLEQFKHFVDGVIYALLNTEFEGISDEKDFEWTVKEDGNKTIVRLWWIDYYVGETGDAHQTYIDLTFTDESERKIVKEIYDAMEEIQNAPEPEAKYEHDLYVDMD